MARSSILGGERAATQPAGRDADALGPSDSSDSGSDIQGQPSLETYGDRDDRLGAAHADRGSDSDAAGTGERGSALGDEDVAEGSDISPDRIEAIGSDLTSDADEDTVDAVHRRTGDIAAEEYDAEDDPDA
jgi:hypothetical protein